METEFPTALEVLAGGGVEFVIVGGLAATVHGAVRLTEDLDVVYRRTPENLARLEKALSSHAPYLRGAPAGLPFQLDADTLRRGLNFTLTTTAGDIDVLGEVTGLGGYGELAIRADVVDLYGANVRILSLEDLIRSKAAAGRAKDLVDLEALRALAKK